MFPSLKTWRLGRVLGFPIELSASFLILLALFFMFYGGLLGLFVASVLAVSVVLHELGHAVVARHYGMRVHTIELGFMGGVAKISGMPGKAKHEIAFAAAGPAVSLALALLGFGIGALFQSQVIFTIGWINLVLAGFNLIPALPMDGGRILRAALTYKFTYLRATEIAIQIARVTAVGFIIIALTGGPITLLVLGPFLWLAGKHELMMARVVQEETHGFPDDPDRELSVMARGAWERDQKARGFDPYGGTRRYTIRQVNGRIVIDAID